MSTLDDIEKSYELSVKLKDVYTLEQLQNEVRYFRTELLKETDYLALLDGPGLTEDQNKYRKELRDITTNVDFDSDPYSVLLGIINDFQDKI